MKVPQERPLSENLGREGFLFSYAIWGVFCFSHMKYNIREMVKIYPTVQGANTAQGGGRA
jgi:hypothetical protein